VSADLTPSHVIDGAGVKEEPLVLAINGEPMVGVLSLPAAPTRIGVVIVVGGPQYRAGSHRQFVSLAWALAGAGYAALRFDYRGIGDSGGTLRNFEQIDDDLRAAIDALRERLPQIDHVVLWGLCDGASAALMYAPTDARVSALALANPWARGADTQARTQLVHYYARRLFSLDVWRRALTGRLRLRESVSDLGASVQQAVAAGDMAASDYRQRMIDALSVFRGPVLWLMSSADLTAREFEVYMGSDARRRRLLTAERCTRTDLHGADHTFSGTAAEAAAAAATTKWLAGLAALPRSTASR
jgi:exosortase A-associated hydrolase 1